MVPGSEMLWYVVLTTFIAHTWSFPDAAIGKKYILARTGNGYELVADNSNMPGIPVSSVNLHSAVRPQPRNTGVTPKPTEIIAVTSPTPPSTSAQPSTTAKSLMKENGSAKDQESVVTLALQGHDGSNGRPGAKGKRGPPGPSGRQGPPGLKGKPGTCKTPEFQCDMNVLQSLTKRISQLEKTCFKIRKSLTRPVNS